MKFPDMFRLDGQRLSSQAAAEVSGGKWPLPSPGAGADVALVARPSDSLQQTAEDIRALGRTVWTLEADIGDLEACQEACARALEQIGPSDILINNVGGRRLNVPTEEMPLDQWLALMDLNLTSTFLSGRP